MTPSKRTGLFRDFVSQIPWRHPFVWLLGSLILVISVLPLSWPEFFAGVFLVAALTAVAWPRPALEPTSVEDWHGYPFDDPTPRAYARVRVQDEPITYRVETGEVVDEIPAPVVRQIGAGR